MALVEIDITHLDIRQKKRELVLLAKKSGNVHMLNYMLYKLINFGERLHKPYNTQDDVIDNMYKSITGVYPRTRENIEKNFDEAMRNWKTYKKTYH